MVARRKWVFDQLFDGMDAEKKSRMEWIGFWKTIQEDVKHLIGLEILSGE